MPHATAHATDHFTSLPFTGRLLVSSRPVAPTSSGSIGWAMKAECDLSEQLHKGRNASRPRCFVRTESRPGPVGAAEFWTGRSRDGTQAPACHPSFRRRAASRRLQPIEETWFPYPFRSQEPESKPGTIGKGPRTLVYSWPQIDTRFPIDFYGRSTNFYPPGGSIGLCSFQGRTTTSLVGPHHLALCTPCSDA